MKPLFCASLAMLLPLTAMAVEPVAASAPEKPARTSYFSRVDKNHDNAITKQEWRMKSDAAFKKLDANNDGNLSLDEYRAKYDASFAKADTNRDGNISAQEMANRKAKRKAASKPSSAAPTADSKPAAATPAAQ